MNNRRTLSPAHIDALATGRLPDASTPGLSIEIRESGKKHWLYRRRIARSGLIVRLSLGSFPAVSIASARAQAALLNDQIEAGVDPRAVDSAAAERAKMTVELSHDLYMTAVHEGRASRAKRINKARTIADKLAIYAGDIAPKLRGKVIYDLSESDLTKLVIAKGRLSPVRANRLAAELKVFFGWASSLRGTEIGLLVNPAARLTDLKFAEAPRTRKFSAEEIGWFLRALADEPQHYQRGMLLLLLTAARLSEVIEARSEELDVDVWTIPEERTKNFRVHRIALGPWGLSLFRSKGEWLFPSTRVEGPRLPSGWYKARNRVLARMSDYAGRSIDGWTPHDMRRTARSNTKRLNVDFETAEAMLNHAKKGLERTYDGYALEDEKREWFQKWEAELTAIAIDVGVARALRVPSA
jgi:integrase